MLLRDNEELEKSHKISLLLWLVGSASIEVCFSALFLSFSFRSCLVLQNSHLDLCLCCSVSAPILTRPVQFVNSGTVAVAEIIRVRLHMTWQTNTVLVVNIDLLIMADVTFEVNYIKIMENTR